MSEYLKYGKKKVPKTLRQCYAEDRVSGELWEWYNKVETLGHGLMVVLIICAVIATFYNGFFHYETSTSYYGGVSTELEFGFDFISLIVTAFMWSVYVLIEYVVFRMCALALSSLASIVQNTKISADVSLYNASRLLEADKGEEADKVQKETTKNQKTKSFLTEIKKTDGRKWICDVCGCQNEISALFCRDCGKYR